jgi:hypothetical protein
MTANKSVTANFGYPLSVAKAGIGLYISKNCLLKSKISNCPTKRAPDGWDCARFLEVVLSFGRFPFPSLVLPSRR